MFDSLGITHPNVFKTLRDYLVDEAKEKRGMDISKDSLHGVYAKVPTQSNFCDCGVFLLHYVEKFLNNPGRYLPDILVPIPIMLHIQKPLSPFVVSLLLFLALPFVAGTF